MTQPPTSPPTVLDVDSATSTEQLNRWVENSLVSLVFLATLSLYEYVHFSPFCLVVPFSISSFKQVVSTVRKRGLITSMHGKCAFVCELISTSSNSLFYLGLPALWGVVPTPALVAPLGVEVLMKVVLRWLVTSECYLFSELVGFT
jgi:hypothetical protein